MSLSALVTAQLSSLESLSFKGLMQVKLLLKAEMALITKYELEISELETKKMNKVLTSDETKTLTLLKNYYDAKGKKEKEAYQATLFKITTLQNQSPRTLNVQIKHFQDRITSARTKLKKTPLNDKDELAKYITTDDLLKIYQYLSSPMVRHELRNLTAKNKGVHLSKKDTKLARTITILRDEDGEFRSILETKSKDKYGRKPFKGKHGMTGGYKEGKPAWRIDSPEPLEYVNLVVRDVEDDDTLSNIDMAKSESLKSLAFESPYTIRLHPTAERRKALSPMNTVKQLSVYGRKAAGDLSKFLHENKLTTDKVKLKIACEILAGLKYLHDDKQEVHQDLKPQNILIFKDGNTYKAKISDYGLSKGIGDQDTTSVATNGYQTPHMSLYEKDSDRKAYYERSNTNTKKDFPRFLADNYAYLFKPENYDPSPQPENDIWATGILLFELFNPAVSTTEITPNNKLLKLMAGHIIGNDSEKIIQKMLLPSPDGRIDAYHALYGFVTLLYQACFNSQHASNSSEFFYEMYDFALNGNDENDPTRVTLKNILKEYMPLNLEIHQDIINELNENAPLLEPQSRSTLRPAAVISRQASSSDSSSSDSDDEDDVEMENTDRISEVSENGSSASYFEQSSEEESGDISQTSSSEDMSDSAMDDVEETRLPTQQLNSPLLASPLYQGPESIDAEQPIDSSFDQSMQQVPHILASPVSKAFKNSLPPLLESPQFTSDHLDITRYMDYPRFLPGQMSDRPPSLSEESEPLSDTPSTELSSASSSDETGEQSPDFSSPNFVHLSSNPLSPSRFQSLLFSPTPGLIQTEEGASDEKMDSPTKFLQGIHAKSDNKKNKKRKEYDADDVPDQTLGSEQDDEVLLQDEDESMQALTSEQDSINMPQDEEEDEPNAKRKKKSHPVAAAQEPFPVQSQRPQFLFSRANKEKEKKHLERKIHPSKDPQMHSRDPHKPLRGPQK